MKTKKLTTTILALIVAFNLSASVIIITNGYKTIRDQKTVKPNDKSQNFLISLIH